MHLARRALQGTAAQLWRLRRWQHLSSSATAAQIRGGWPVSLHRALSSTSSSSYSSPSWHRPDGGGGGGGGSGTSVSVDEARRLLTVTWPPPAAGDHGGTDEACSVLPLAWLRDSCQCPECFNAVTQSRTLPFNDFNPRVPVKSATLSSDSGGTLTVEWQDGHRSSFARSWLQERSFTNGARLRRQSGMMFTTREKSWRQELQEFNYSELMRNDSTLLELLQHLDRFGTLLVKEAPPELSSLVDFGTRLGGFLSPCNYGHSFEVKSKLNPSSAAYTTGYLGLHIDQCFYGRRPGVQMLHCISQPNDGSIVGGESLLADGFLAASMLKRSLPEHYQALASLPIDFNDYGSDYIGKFHLINRETVLRLNSMGDVDRVTFSSHSRDYYQNHLAPEKVQLLYEALKAFYDIVSRPPCVIEHKMETGDIQLTDNRRVLHGRNAFSVRGEAERFLHGGYVEWDEIYSRIRRLEKAAGGAS